ncbi:MAG: cytochrome P450 [Bacteroidetes bacterium]|nr:cytochrome P450 [Bacteroidota bacterium]MCY4234335.1 cytochrome P450 [Bacteroidota bacterium]
MTDLHHSPSLLITEELFILLIDRQHGGIIEINDRNLRHAIVGAVLMDLANANRIDTDLDHLIVIDASTTNDNIMDYFLTVLDGYSKKLNVSGWIKHFSSAEICNYIRRRIIDRLIKRRIMNRDPGGILWIDQQVELTGRYPEMSLPQGLDVSLRAMNIVVTDEIPTPEETMLIALIEACGISESVFSKSITTERKDRIQLISRMDNIGRSIRQSIIDASQPLPEKDVISQINRNLSATLHERPPMMPRSLPLLGHSYFLRPIPTVPLAHYYKTLGPVFRIRDYRNEYTVLCGPEANLFCQRRSRSLFSSYNMYSSLVQGLDVQRLLLSMDGQEHLKIRRELSSGFSSERYLNQLPKIRDIILGEVPEEGAISASYMFTHNVAKSIGWACNEYVPSTQQVNDLDYFFRHLVPSSTLRHFPNIFKNFRAGNRYEDAKNGFFSIFRSMSKDFAKDKGQSHKTDLLSSLLEFHQKSPQMLSESEVKVFSLAPIFAGMHNTASTLTSAIYLLLKHPYVLRQVQAESDQLYGGSELKEPTPDNLMKMSVTKRVIKETLRMYNPFSTVFRKVINTFDFGGYTIPSGTTLLIPFGVPNYCEEFFPDPLKFDIDRYLPSRMEHQTSGVFLPYGFGAHQCLGSSISDTHLLFSIATLLYHYDLQMVPSKYKLKMVFEGVPIASKRFKIKFKPREKFHSNMDLFAANDEDNSDAISKCPVAH